MKVQDFELPEHYRVETGGFWVLLSLLCVYNLQDSMQYCKTKEPMRRGGGSGGTLPRVKI
jgi:hypothetical protein